jgi:hypothetical protein
VRRIAFGLRSAFLSAVTQGYLDLSESYCSMMQILVLLSYPWVLLSGLCFILASSSQDIAAIWPVSAFVEACYFVHDCRQKPYMSAALFQQCTTIVLIQFIDCPRINDEFALKPVILLMDDFDIDRN